MTEIAAETEDRRAKYEQKLEDAGYKRVTLRLSQRTRERLAQLPTGPEARDTALAEALDLWLARQ